MNNNACPAAGKNTMLRLGILLTLLHTAACGGGSSSAPPQLPALIEFLSLDGLNVGIDGAGKNLFVSLGAGFDEPKPYQARFNFAGVDDLELVIDSITVGNDEVFEFEAIEYGSEVPCTVQGAARESESWSFVFLSLPILQLTAPIIVDEPKSPGLFQLSVGGEENDSGVLLMGVEWRGGVSVFYPKKNMAVELEEKIRILEMRKDDDWILDGAYNDLSLVRNRLAHNLFLDMRPEAHEKGGQSTIDGSFLEIVLNRRYCGAFVISEQVDRKLLDLDKESNGSVLYKAIHPAADLSMKKPLPIFFEQKYPDPKSKLRWEPLEELVKFLAESSDEEFTDTIWKRVDKENVVDWYLLVLLASGKDNLIKNYYLARNKNKRFFFVPWDFDGTWGFNYLGEKDPDGKWWPNGHNALIARLIALPETRFYADLKERWEALREDEWSEKALIAQFTSLVAELEKGNAYRRNLDRWGLADKKTPIREAIHFDYFKSWIRDRLEFLDEKIEEIKSET